MKQVRQFKLWSNIFFLIPLGFAVTNKVFWYSLIIGLVFVISTIFHLSEEKKFIHVDTASSIALIVSNFILLFLGHWITPYSLLAIFFAIVALFFYFRQNKHNYDINHGLWHIFSAGVSFFSLMTLLNFLDVFVLK